MMAITGPVPTRSEERRRRNARTEAGEAVGAEIVEADGVVEPPLQPDSGWHMIAQELFASVQKSAFTRFYEPSDWMVLYLACESLSRDLSEQFVGINESTGEVIRDFIPLKGASLGAYSKVFASLLLTDGDRRRLRLEIERRDAVDAITKAMPEVVADRADIFKVLPGGKTG
jgi:hypothetical protein